MDMGGIQILYVKSEVLATKQYDVLPILKYPCIIVGSCCII